jgi:hypothetical protein
MQLAIISIDRDTLVDASERFAHTEQKANRSYDEQLDPVAWSDLFWQTALAPDLVQQDALVPGALEQVKELKALEYTVILLASRPESMRTATEAWLKEHEVPYDFLVLKYPAFQYVKNVFWQASTVHQLALALKVSELLYFDADATNRAEVSKYSSPNAPVARLFDDQEQLIARKDRSVRDDTRAAEPFSPSR